MRCKPLDFLSLPVFLTLLCLAAVAAGETRTWDAGGDAINWFDPNNWDPNGIPADSDILTVLSGSPATTLEVRSDNGGSITLDGSALAWFETLNIGHSGSAALSILNGASLSNTFGYVGYAAGSTGTVTVDGAGSTWDNLEIGRASCRERV